MDFANTYLTIIWLQLLFWFQSIGEKEEGGGREKEKFVSKKKKHSDMELNKKYSWGNNEFNPL